MQKVSIDHKIVKARKTSDGVGANIKRVFPGPTLHHIDPFVLLDEFFVTANTSFPEHPHKGFEAITYMLEGAFRHKDNLGNDSTVIEGGAQRFSAGQELRHAEYPGTNGMNHGLQLWINLPKDLKEMKPEYQKVEADKIPVFQKSNAVIHTIVGENSPLKLNTDIIYQDIKLARGAKYEKNIPQSWNSVIYVIENELNYENQILSSGEAIILEKPGKIVVNTAAKTRFALIAGRPHKTKIRQRGSIVL